ncbi:hypothetical protein FT643_20420 [Ketobacter sp. MCCC 1A13808]|uniref:DUF7064 domain-containing protein n=1 Tax=Ketobacter sp. MCCC 1A13808 TaxID=2602738 RepID=UPI0012EC3339|nr:hypothetical protein [Ketobacter sp. MCCC 1A13808]MVF14506.1 hypothetical protein [Ketobacter sp. MCCC 1A13808]
MDLSQKASIRLRAQDEGMHPIEKAHNFNESMYFNLFDHQQKIGGWFRLGNRPNEGHAEMSFCFYLPDGRVAFMFRRAAIDNNDALNAGGMAFDVIKPLHTLRVTYTGEVCVLADPQAMENPKQAFADNPHVHAKLDLTFQGFTPVYGGEAVDNNGKPIEEAPDEAFARGHYEQHMRGNGQVGIGDEQFDLNGFGLRDHSWGPRYWQNLYWYRWLPMVFSDQLAINISIVTMASGRQHIWGMVYDCRNGGPQQYDLIDTAELESTLDSRLQAQSQTATITTVSGRRYQISGQSLALIPLRNRRQTNTGEWRTTRITEAMTRFECDGMVGYGMSEYLDQIMNDEPVGKAC